MRRWEDLPDFMRTDEVRPYWEIMWKKRGHLAVKRMFDVITAVILLLLAAIFLQIQDRIIREIITNQK